MQKTNQYQSGVQGIIIRARQYNSNIGDYVEHFVDESFNFTVKLSNGRVNISSNTAQDQETMPTSISEERIKQIANNFQSNNPPTVTPTQTSIAKSTTWQRVLRSLGL